MFCKKQTSATETTELKPQRLIVPETIFQDVKSSWGGGHRTVSAKKIKLIGPSLLQEISAPPALSLPVSSLTYYLPADDNCIACRRSALPQFIGCQRFLLSVSSRRKKICWTDCVHVFLRGRPLACVLAHVVRVCVF